MAADHLQTNKNGIAKQSRHKPTEHNSNQLRGTYSSNEPMGGYIDTIFFCVKSFEKNICIKKWTNKIVN